MERKVTTMGGNIVTLMGPELKVGDKAPDFVVRNTDLFQVTLDDFQGKIKLISSAPSLDTTICDLQTKRFNQEAASFKTNVVVISISMDLPFALKRWCGSTGVDRVTVLSDYLDASFGLGFGVLIKELRLLNRAVFICDENNTIRYIEIVTENNNHPNYESALEALRRLG